ncbi:MAG: sensor histidine kinase, partial [Bacillota bacterium]
MRWGLFHKLMFTYLAVAIITVTTLGVAFHRLLINYTIEAKQGELVKEGIQLNQIAASYLLSGQDRRSLIFLLSLLDRFSGARVWVVDKTGLILLASQDTGFARGHMFSVQGLRLGPEEIRLVLEGETVRQIGQNPYFNEQMLTVAVPVTTGGGPGTGEVLGAIFLNAPLTGTTETVKTLLKYLGWAALVAAVISTLLGVYLSRKISRPLREMRQAALAMAGGDYGSRIQVHSGDEVGELALAFNNMASQAEQVEQMRREFVANASHELRTPLTVIRGYNDALMDEVISDPDKRNSYHLVIREETIRLERLVRDLLDLSRLQSGKVEAGMEPLDAKGVIVATAAKMAETAKARDTAIQLLLPDSMPETMGNEDWLTQL